MPRIEVHQKGQPPFEVQLGLGEFVVGRGRGCDLQIHDPFISSRNTSITLQAVVRDLGSTNGTWVRGQEVKEASVGNGETIIIGRDGSVEMRIFLEEMEKGPDSTVSFEGGPLDAAAEAELQALRGKVSEREQRIAELEQSLEAAERSAGSPESSEEGEGREGEDARRRIEQLEEELRGRDAEIGRLRAAAEEAEKNAGARVEAAPPPESEKKEQRGEGKTVLLSRVAELQEKLRHAQAARAAAESKLNVLSGPGFTGAQQAISMIEERDKTIHELKQSLEDVQRRLEHAEKNPRAGGGAGAEGREELIEAFAKSGDLGLEQGLLDVMRERNGIVADTGFVLGKMYRFSRDVEKVVTRMAQLYRGGMGAGDETMIPGVMGNLSRSVHGLLLRGGDKLRKDLESYLDNLRIWYVACISAYKTGTSRWCQEILGRLSPDVIQKSVQVPAWKKVLALEAWEYWQRYRSVMEDLTPDIASDQIEEYAARAAVELAEKEGAW